MTSEASRKKAEEILGGFYPQPGRLTSAIAAALDEARAEGEAKATAVLHDLLTACWGAIDPERFKGLHDELSEELSCEGDGPCAQYGRDLDNARAEGEQRGAERERWECYRTVCTATNSEHAVRLIAARGPMRGPEESDV